MNRMRKLDLTFTLLLMLAACQSDSIEPKEVKAVLQGFRDDTNAFNPCNGWIFNVGSNFYPANEVPQKYRDKKNVNIWLRFEKDTLSFRGKNFTQCNLIRVIAIRDRHWWDLK